jgi:hypothetical protein
MPPMITTIRELSRNLSSWPGATDSTVPPKTPASPARADPRKNAAAKTSCTFTPSADAMAPLSTPARTTMPKRVRWMSSHKERPMSAAPPITNRRNDG